MFMLIHRQRADSKSGGTAHDWKARRAALVDRDKVLLSQTHLWLRRIPRKYQPKQLCRYYPRVANAIAESWDDPTLGDRLLNDLLIDRRGDRAGFPVRIVYELQVLHRLRVNANHKAHITGRVVRALTNAFAR